MIKADYPDRESLEDVLLEATKNPREPVSLRLDSGERLLFKMNHHDNSYAFGKMTEAPYALITVDLNTREVTIT